MVRPAASPASLLAHPPGRLRVRAGMARVRVELPTCFWPLVVVSRAFLGLLACGAAAGLAGEPAVAGMAAILALPWLYARLLAEAIRAQGQISIASKAALLLGWLALLYTGIALTDRSLGFQLYYLAFQGTAVLCLGLAALAPGRGSAVVIDGAKLEIVGRGQGQVFDLESIGRVEQAAGWLEQVRIDGQPVPALRGLTGPERAWLTERIEDAARRRREALAEQGHDLSVEARPPRELLVLRASL